MKRHVTLLREGKCEACRVCILFDTDGFKIPPKSSEQCLKASNTLDNSREYGTILERLCVRHGGSPPVGSRYRSQNTLVPDPPSIALGAIHVRTFFEKSPPLGLQTVSGT